MLGSTVVDQVDGLVDCVSQRTGRELVWLLFYGRLFYCRESLWIVSGNGQGVRIKTQKSRMAGSFKSYGMI